jgi:dTDP-4-amino-4,6-dideoxygalactose transaminase
MTGKELYYIAEAKFGNILAGDGPFTKRCHQWLERKSGCSKALLTHSCTAALEMAALLLNIVNGNTGFVVPIPTNPLLLTNSPPGFIVTLPLNT